MDKSLTSTEQTIMDVLDELGFDSTQGLCFRIMRPKYIVHRSLNMLFRLGLIIRQPKGMNFSIRWLDENPNRRDEIEEFLGTPLF